MRSINQKDVKKTSFFSFACAALLFPCSVFAQQVTEFELTEQFDLSVPQTTKSGKLSTRLKNAMHRLDNDVEGFEKKYNDFPTFSLLLHLDIGNGGNYNKRCKGGSPPRPPPSVIKGGQGDSHAQRQL